MFIRPSWHSIVILFQLLRAKLHTFVSKRIMEVVETEAALAAVATLQLDVAAVVVEEAVVVVVRPPQRIQTGVDLGVDLDPDHAHMSAAE